MKKAIVSIALLLCGLGSFAQTSDLAVRQVEQETGLHIFAGMTFATAGAFVVGSSYGGYDKAWWGDVKRSGEKEAVTGIGLGLVGVGIGLIAYSVATHHKRLDLAKSKIAPSNKGIGLVYRF